MSYQVGVDLGTTYSAAARCRDGGPVELVPLDSGPAPCRQPCTPARTGRS